LNNRGFTLIESLVSIILLSICLTGGIAFYFNASEIMALTIHKKIAMEMANQAAEKYKEMGYLNLPPVSADWVPEAAVTFGDFTAKTRRWIKNVIGDPPNTKQVEFEVRWTEAGKTEARSINLITYISNL